MKTYRFGIVGCGLIGNKRAAAIQDIGKILMCSDLNIDLATKLSDKFGGVPTTNFEDVINNQEIDILIISTTHQSLAKITQSALQKDKHILVEKPAGISRLEIENLLNLSSISDKKVRVGFNHRFHPAILKAKEIIDSGSLGGLMFLRARYGHGGRLGYEKEWRADPKISGGGEVIDQGSHLIDLSRMFLGNLVSSKSVAKTFFWDMPVEDNGFMILESDEGKVAFLHASCTEWKNLFSMEIYGKMGKLEINGLGGSYGPETLIHYQMSPKMGIPEKFLFEFPSEDLSWSLEIIELIKDIEQNRSSTPGLKDMYEVFSIIESIYKDSGYDYS